MLIVDDGDGVSADGDDYHAVDAGAVYADVAGGSDEGERDDVACGDYMGCCGC